MGEIATPSGQANESVYIYASERLFWEKKWMERVMRGGLNGFEIR